MPLNMTTSTSKFQNIIWHLLPVVAILLWGALCLTDELWYDEAYSAGLVMQPWSRMVYITAIDAHSPFYYALLKLVYLAFGGGTCFRVLKCFSLLFMAGFMLLGKYYVGHLFGKTVSCWFMTFSMLMPAMAVQAGNVRMYAMALFFMTLAVLSAYDLLHAESKRKWIVFCLSTIATMYCHTFAMIEMFWFYCILLVLLIRRKNWAFLRRFLVCGGVAGITFLPWLAVTILQMRNRMLYDTGSTTELAQLSSLVDYCKEWFSAVETPINLVVVIGVAIAITLITLAIRGMRNNGNSMSAIGGAAWILTVLTGWIVSLTVDNCFMGRYGFPGFGSIMLLYALGMSGVKKRGVKAGILVAAALCFILQYHSELQLEYDGGLDSYQEFLTENVSDEDTIVFSQGHSALLSVYDPNRNYYLDGYVNSKLPFPNLQECYDLTGLKQADGRVWYIAFAGERVEQDGVECREAYQFHYMYYDFVVYEIL